MNIVFEDEQILITDKPSGLVVNRSETTTEETLQDQISKYLELSDLGIGDRAGIVHRLDRETSGLLIVAKDQKAFENLQQQFKDRTIQKKYIALVHGALKENKGSVVAAIGRVGKFGKFGIVKEGRESVTDFRVDAHYLMPDNRFDELIHQGNLTKSRINYLKNHARQYTLCAVFPKTGRTHQVRVHLKSIGHAVVSDSIYAPNKLLKLDLLWCPRLFLHAARVNFQHPKDGKKVEFKSPLPKDLKSAILNLTKVR